MPADNPSLILQTLNARLGHDVVPAQQSERMNDDVAFWDALTAANGELQPLGIYLTRIFEEWQIIMRREWFAHRVPILRPVLKHLRLFRPATPDLILSKMMRGDDPQHMDEIRWMIGHESISAHELETAFHSAHVPDDADILSAFEIAKPLVHAMVKQS